MSDRKAHLDARFADFDRANPAVYGLFVAFAARAKDSGVKRLGAKAIAERVRWECAVETRGDTVKINNDYVSRYARKVAAQRPDLADLFEFRSLRS